jgi:hypothetical protein
MRALHVRSPRAAVCAWAIGGAMKKQENSKGGYN